MTSTSHLRTSTGGAAATRSRRSRHIALASLAWLLTFWIGSGSAHADFRSEFRDGMIAFEKERYQEAEAAFRRALAQRPSADDVKISVGRRRMSYIPNAMLAITLARLGRCEEAFPYFESANNQGIVAREGPVLGRQLKSAREECARTIASAWIRATETTLEQSRQIVARITGVLANPDTAGLLADRAAIEARTRKAADMVQNAASLLEAGQRSSWFLALRDARQTATSAQEALVALARDVEADLQSAVGSLLQKTASNLESALKEEAAARTAIGAVSSRASSVDLRSRLDAASKRLAVVRTGLEAARNDKDPVQIADLNRAARETRESLSALTRDARAANKTPRATADLPKVPQSPAANRDRTSAEPPAPTPAGTDARQGNTPDAADEPPPPAETRITSSEVAGPTPTEASIALELDAETGLPKALVDGANAYFRGQYQQALNQLSEVVATRLETFSPAAKRAPITAQAALLRAAACFALYRLGAEQDPTLLDEARRELGVARTAAPDLEIDGAFFSPAFRALDAELPREHLIPDPPRRIPRP